MLLVYLIYTLCKHILTYITLLIHHPRICVRASLVKVRGVSSSSDFVGAYDTLGRVVSLRLSCFRCCDAFVLEHARDGTDFIVLADRASAWASAFLNCHAFL